MVKKIQNHFEILALSKKNCSEYILLNALMGFQQLQVPSMWFWSVSWSTNCPVYFSLFLVDQKKFVQSQGIFGQSLNFFGQSLNLFGQALIFWLQLNEYQTAPKFIFSIPKNQSLTKKIQRLTKNSLRLNKFFFGRPKK